MHLFISNFKKSVILSGLLSFVIISILYYIVVSLLPKDLNGTNQWQTNVLKAQEYLFSKKQYSIVLVGSSELYNVPVNEISNNYFNLAFAGGCSSTGLEIVIQRNIKPKVLFVEMNNTVIRGLDKNMLKQCEWWHELPFGRENNRPDYVVGNAYNLLKERIRPKKKELKDAEINLSEVARQVAGNQEFKSPEIFKENIQHTKVLIDLLRDEGVYVVLVEPPNNLDLYNTPNFREVRKYAQEVFPEKEYDWYTVDWSEYTTGDGIHLQPASAMRYANDLIQYVKERGYVL